MTPSEKQQLAEQAAEFLGGKKNPDGSWEIRITPRDDNYDKWTADIYQPEVAVFEFFEDHETAPILMALGKREMEKRGFWWRADGSPKEGLYSYTFTKIESARPEVWRELEQIEDNEYIAFWMALMEAVKGGKDES